MYQQISLQGFSFTSSIFELLWKSQGVDCTSSLLSIFECKAYLTHLESVVNVSFVDSPTNPLYTYTHIRTCSYTLVHIHTHAHSYTIVLLAGLPFGLTVASWKKVEYFSSLFSSRDFSKALRHGAAAVMLIGATMKGVDIQICSERQWRACVMDV